ncbi:MAG: hydroxyacylglutathione hydrolase [Myxococcota bacterium]
MKHVVRYPSRPFLSADGSLEIHQIPAWQDNLIWLAICTRTGEAAAIDGPEAGPVQSYCEGNQIRWTTILNTHTHGDHVGINRDLDGKGLLSQMRVVGPKKVSSDIPGITEMVTEGDEVRIGKAVGKVMVTEGHLNGHVSYVFDNVLFCGDTLFAGGCGFLFDGPPKKMFNSLLRLRELEGSTHVCCAHEYTQDNLRFAWSVEPENTALRDRIRKVWMLRHRGECAVPSTIDEERATNPFLRFDSEAVRKHVGAAMPDEPLDSNEAVFAATRALKDRKDYRTIGDADLPLA